MSVGELTPPRFGTPRRIVERRSLGRYITPIGRSMAVELHPWQRHVSSVSLELVERDEPRLPTHSRQRLAYATVGVLVPRQTGKTTWAAMRVALQCLLPELGDVFDQAGAVLGVGRLGGQHTAFTAQDRSSALGRWREHVEMMRASDLVWSHVDKVRLQRGEEAVMFTNGSTYRIITPNEVGARGLSLDLAIIDEALVHEPTLLRAVAPTMAQRDGATTSVGAQLVVVSNAGDERAHLLNEQRELGRRAVAEGDTSRAWFEWSAPDDADPFDPEVWRATIPTLDQPDGISSAFIARQAESPDLVGFRREYLCQSVTGPVGAAVDLEAWEAAPTADLVGTDPVFAIDARPDGDYSCIVVAGMVGDTVGVEVVEAREGTAWVMRSVVRRLEHFRGALAVDANGPLGHLVAPIERLGFEVFRASGSDVVNASAAFAQLVASGHVAHRHDERLTRAVEASQRQRVGDRWRFSRSTRGADLVVAASLAAWGSEQFLLTTPSLQ